MEDKFPMNLQFFADDSDSAPEAGAPEGTEDEQTSEPAESQQPAEKTFTQDEVNKMIQKRLDRAMKDKQQEIDDAKSEAVKYAKMNKDEKAKHDLETARSEAKKAQEELARYQLRDATRKELVAGGYKPTDADIDIVVTGDAETTRDNTKAFLDMVERVRSSVRDELLKGNTPTAGGLPVKKQKALKDMSLMERVKLRQEDPQRYQDLVNESGY